MTAAPSFEQQLSISLGGMPTHALYPLSNYAIGSKNVQMEEDPSVAARLKRLEDEYYTLGMRRTVEAVLLVHEHHHPHVLLTQIGDSYFKLPSDQLKPGEDEYQGLKRALNLRLGPTTAEEEAPAWEIGELVGVWWRARSENVYYPYVPAHITKPREMRKLFLIHLPERCTFHVPRNMKLVAVPFFDLFDSQKRYGNQLSTLPHLASRINFKCID